MFGCHMCLTDPQQLFVIFCVGISGKEKVETVLMRINNILILSVVLK